jgi:hypothetical protein
MVLYPRRLPFSDSRYYLKFGIFSGKCWACWFVSLLKFGKFGVINNSKYSRGLLWHSKSTYRPRPPINEKGDKKGLKLGKEKYLLTILRKGRTIEHGISVYMAEND